MGELLHLSALSSSSRAMGLPQRMAVSVPWGGQRVPMKLAAMPGTEVLLPILLSVTILLLPLSVSRS